RFGASRANLGPIADHLHGGIANAVTLRGQQPLDVAEEVRTTRTLPFRAAGAEHIAQIAKPSSRQQCVAQRMSGHVTGGVAGATVGVFEQQAQQPARPTGFDWVYVGAEPDSRDRHHCLQDAAARTSSRMVAALASSVFSASASSPTRICRALASIRFSPADRPRSWSRR